MNKKSIYQLNKLNISHILAIDYGMAKIGLAMADSETKIAFAFDVFANNKNFLQNLTNIIKKQNVNLIIIGIPAYANGKIVKYEGEELGKTLKKIFPDMEIEYQNEMFTTKMAQNNLIEKGMRNIGQKDDAEAARIILQSWLEKISEQKSGNRN